MTTAAEPIKRPFTPRIVCEAWIRHNHPEITDEEAISAKAREFWNSSPDGGVVHVFEAMYLLMEVGVLEKESTDPVLWVSSTTGERGGRRQVSRDSKRH